MSLARVADTSWLYAIFDDKDPHHDEAVSLLRAPLITLVPAGIMNELLDLVKYRANKQASLQAQDSLESFPHFDTWYHVDGREATQVWRQHPRLSLHDAHAVALARRTGFPLCTFDKHQAEAAAKEGIDDGTRHRTVAPPAQRP